ncbi:MAG: hypothetical protein R6U37_02690 [Dehalococcoidia bacterium]
MKQRRIGKSVSVSNLTLIPLEEDTFSLKSGKRWQTGWVSAVPVGFVMVSSEGKQAYDVNGEKVPLADYLQQFEGLAEILRKTDIQGTPE